MAAEDWLVEDCLCESIQTVKAKSHVDGMESYKYAGRRRNAQHRLPRINRARS